MKILARLVPAILVLALTSCGTIGLSVDRGQIASNIFTNREQLGKNSDSTEEGYSPEQEYFIGRGVAARILGDKRYPASTDEKVRKYVNLLGICLASSSTKPETFHGWHFLVLDSTEINAFSAPSGFVLASRELLRCAKSEDEVAAILAHEIGHVVLQHGINAISAANKAAAAKENAKTVFKGAVRVELPFGISIGVDKLGKLFNVSVLDIVETLANKGYSREQEYQADAAAVSILLAAGYDPRALVRMLEVMQTKWKKDGLGFMKTHPAPADRIKEAEKAIAAASAPAAPTATAAAARQARYQAALGKI
jgi:beta-barrel assembly-enhancing protease